MVEHTSTHDAAGTMAERIELPGTNGMFFIRAPYAWPNQHRFDLIGADGRSMGPPWIEADARAFAAALTPSPVTREQIQDAIYRNLPGKPIPLDRCADAADAVRALSSLAPPSSIPAGRRED